MKLLDLYCGAGGAAVGYHKAGFDEIVGVDIIPQKNYPFDFICADALNVDLDYQKFDLIHASPPCQRFSTASDKSRHHPDLLRPTRTLLSQQTHCHYVIENVVGAPMVEPLILCGTLFGNLRVLRHRLFECSFDIPQPQLDCYNHPKVYTTDSRRKDFGKLDEWKDYVSVYGGNHATLAACKDAMNIDWMNRKELSQAIPPDYTEFIGNYFLKKMV
jgi:DNA (cytosine-5)-methyltransferase 1